MKATIFPTETQHISEYLLISLVEESLSGGITLSKVVSKLTELILTHLMVMLQRLWPFSLRMEDMLLQHLTFFNAIKDNIKEVEERLSDLLLFSDTSLTKCKPL